MSAQGTERELIDWLRADLDIPIVDEVGLQARDTMLANYFPLAVLFAGVSIMNAKQERRDALLSAISLCCEDEALLKDDVNRNDYDDFIRAHRNDFIATDRRRSLAADFCETYLNGE